MIKAFIGYQGGKFLLTEKLYNTMIKYKPKAKNFIDVFGGGGSMSYYFLQKGFNVWYNDYDKKIYQANKYCYENEIPKDAIYKYIDRDEFEYIKKKKVKTEIECLMLYIYSYSNNATDYYRAKEFCNISKAIFEYVVKPDKNQEKIIDKFILEHNISNKEFDFEKIKKNIKDIKDIKDRYEFLKRNSNNIIDKKIKRILNKNDILIRLENIKNIHKLYSINKNIKFTNIDYKKINFNNYNDTETIIYCDPPYRNTSCDYKHNFQFDEFDRWAKNNKKSIFISEYTTPFIELKTFKKSVSVCATKNYSEYKEKLFINKNLENKEPNIFEFI